MNSVQIYVKKKKKVGGDFSLLSEAKYTVVTAVGGRGGENRSEVENILNDPMNS